MFGISPQNSTLRRWLPLALAGVAVAMGLYFFSSCGTEAGEPRAIVGHTLIKQGVPHGGVAVKAERYCVSCHGASLMGGQNLEPSCYTCHGKNWLGEPGAQSAAASDHSVINQGYHHHPSLFTPDGTCSACHGAGLQGDSNDGKTIPSCLLCHGKIWAERAQ